jgi:hypothetical protein
MSVLSQFTENVLDFKYFVLGEYEAQMPIIWSFVLFSINLTKGGTEVSTDVRSTFLMRVVATCVAIPGFLLFLVATLYYALMYTLFSLVLLVSAGLYLFCDCASTYFGGALRRH